MNLPKRELLLLRVVLAFPNASKTGLAKKSVNFEHEDLILIAYRPKFSAQRAQQQTPIIRKDTAINISWIPFYRRHSLQTQ